MSAITRFIRAKKAKRVLALALALCFAASFLLATVFVFVHSNHHDSDVAGGAACSICLQIHNAKPLTLFAVLAVLGALGGTGLFAIVEILRSCSLRTGFGTLISAKTRLNS